MLYNILREASHAIFKVQMGEYVPGTADWTFGVWTGAEMIVEGLFHPYYLRVEQGEDGDFVVTITNFRLTPPETEGTVGGKGGGGGSPPNKPPGMVSLDKGETCGTFESIPYCPTVCSRCGPDVSPIPWEDDPFFPVPATEQADV